MAIFNPTIYKDISGSVGNVTSYKVGKTQIVRAKTGFVKDAKTPKQLQQRAQIKPDHEIAPQFYHDSKNRLLHPVRQNMHQLFHPGQHRQGERRGLGSSHPRFADPFRYPVATCDFP